MHTWGDDWFRKHGTDLSNAIYECMKFWSRWGRLGSHGKEKYGTFRDHVYFWHGGLHSLVWPGYVWIQNRFIAYWLDRYMVKPFTRLTGLHWIGLRYQYMIYNWGIQKVCRKYPAIVDELVQSIDYPELIRPGLFGRVDGKKIQSKYWREI